MTETVAQIVEETQNDPALTSTEVAELFGVDSNTVKRWARDKKLPSFKTPGGHYRFRKSAVDILLKVQNN